MPPQRLAQSSQAPTLPVRQPKPPYGHPRDRRLQRQSSPACRSPQRSFVTRRDLVCKLRRRRPSEPWLHAPFFRSGFGTQGTKRSRSSSDPEVECASVRGARRTTAGAVGARALASHQGSQTEYDRRNTYWRSFCHHERRGRAARRGRVPKQTRRRRRPHRSVDGGRLWLSPPMRHAMDQEQERAQNRGMRSLSLACFCCFRSSPVRRRRVSPSAQKDSNRPPAHADANRPPMRDWTAPTDQEMQTSP